MPYEETEALIERGLIKVILPKGESLDENAVAVKADLSGLAAMRRADDGQEAEAAPDTDADSGESEEDVDAVAIAAALPREIEIRYRRSFTSRLIQTEDTIKDYYSEIKNELLSYRGVKSRISWSKETFKRGRVPLARMDVKGKTLYLYLALDPARFADTKYIVSTAKGELPTLIKIKGERKKKHALELIALLMAELGLARIEREAEDYRLPYEETEALIERGLIKVILPKGESLDENAVAVKADLSGLAAMRRADDGKKTAEESAAPVADQTVAIEAVEEAAAEQTVTIEVAEEAPAPEAEAAADAEQTAEVTETPEVEEAPEAEAVEETPAADETPIIEETAEAPAEEQTTDGEPACAAEEDVEPIEEIRIEEVENEVALEARLDRIIRSTVSGRSTVVLDHLATPRVRRGGAEASTIGFAFSGGSESGALVVVPYTREQYLALPRKKKKAVLMSVRALLRYLATSHAIEALRSLGSDNERIAERIAALEHRLESEKRVLPTASLWRDAVTRVVK